ncbi:MAG: VOC family protein [Pseudomonadota bacterium]
MSNDVTCNAVYPTLAAPNVADTCNWYIEKLGFTLRFMWGEPATHGALLLGEACVHFWESAAQPNDNWLYFDINAVEAMYERARENGVEITKEPMTYPWGMREFNAVDLNGYNIRFGQYVG